MATWLHLGSAADVDPTEGSYLSENAANLLGSYSHSLLSNVEAFGNDANGDGLISENDLGTNGDTITIDGVTTSLDSIQAYSVTITRGDGTTYNTTIGVAQMTDGNLYVLPSSETDLDFINIQTITLTAVVQDTGPIEYFHFLLPHHEIVFAESAPAESMYLGHQALDTVGDDARDEIFLLFPELEEKVFAQRGARLFAPSKSAPGTRLRNMLEKVRRNNRRLVEGTSVTLA
ncbi:hypothetical protein [uncultured Shimia sp.]|uniref:hypothetical protein n=1 Tax=uncultured Shimia sp. TaxID=573152 RepID=UPI002638E33A|nr:hypothetical protein [uncultured Shimia sp.]